MNFEQSLNNLIIFRKACETASELNTKSYIVGGFVRDLILNQENNETKFRKNEIDFVIIGDGPNFASTLAEKFGIKKINIFKNFGTANFKVEDFELEFVGARKESYTKSSRNPIVTSGSFEEDISRRDFTINTLAISLNEENIGELIDHL